MTDLVAVILVPELFVPTLRPEVLHAYARPSTRGRQRFPLFSYQPCRTLGRLPALAYNKYIMADPAFADPLTWRVVKAPSLVELEVLADRAFQRLPEKFRALCEGLVIRVEDFPTDEVLD